MKIIRSIMYIFLFFIVVLLINTFSRSSWKKNRLNESFKGVVIGEKAMREGTKPLHLIIREDRLLIYKFVTDSVRNYAIKGDSIIKPANQNKIIILRDGASKEFVYRPRWQSDK